MIGSSRDGYYPCLQLEHFHDRTIMVAEPNLDVSLAAGADSHRVSLRFIRFIRFILAKQFVLKSPKGLKRIQFRIQFDKGLSTFKWWSQWSPQSMLGDGRSCADRQTPRGSTCRCWTAALGLRGWELLCTDTMWHPDHDFERQMTQIYTDIHRSYKFIQIYTEFSEFVRVFLCFVIFLCLFRHFPLSRLGTSLRSSKTGPVSRTSARAMWSWPSGRRSMEIW